MGLLFQSDLMLCATEHMINSLTLTYRFKVTSFFILAMLIWISLDCFYGSWHVLEIWAAEMSGSAKSNSTMAL